MANDTLGDSSILLEGDALAERQAEAVRARETLAAQQSITSPGSKPKGVADEDADNALAKAFEEATGENPNSEIPAVGTVTKPPGVPDSPADPKPKKEDAPAEVDDSSKTIDDLLALATKSDDKPLAEPENKPAAEAKPYSEHELPATASVKSKESFSKLKEAAVARENEQRSRAEAAEAKAKAAEEALAKAQAEVGKLTPEIETELKELREHRALYATETDPSFKAKFDARISKNHDDILSYLVGLGLTQDKADAIKKLPRSSREAEFDKLLGLIEDPAQRRPIESKLLQNVGIDQERTEALSEAKNKAESIVKAQRDAPVVSKQAKIDEIANLVRPKLNGLEWFAEKNIPANTPPELRKQMEAQNKWASEQRDALKAAIVNDDPQTRATAALAVPLSQYFARELGIARAKLAAAEAKLDKIQKASATSRLSERASVRSDAPVRTNVDADARDTIDSLFTEAGGKLS